MCPYEVVWSSQSMMGRLYDGKAGADPGFQKRGGC